jgi:hypothetical protein
VCRGNEADFGRGGRLGLLISIPSLTVVHDSGVKEGYLEQAEGLTLLKRKALIDFEV